MRGGHTGHIGGVERQTTMLARWLADRAYPISLLTWDEGQSDGETIDGVRMIKMCRADAGLPVVRFFYPRASSLFAAMREADADVYYHNCEEYYTGLVAMWCRWHKRKFVYSVAHDNDCDVELPALKKMYERVLYKYGLRNAHRIIVQTKRQRDMLASGFGLDSIALPMPCVGPSPADFLESGPPIGKRVLWAGRAAEKKRMEWLLDVSELLPDFEFVIAAANDTTPYARMLFERAKRFRNVRWLGPVPREEMPALYRQATCLCSTSIQEGFPNTFLEAWSHGRPIITSFDPDGVVGRRHLGLICHTIDEFAEAIRNLSRTPRLWADLSKNARRYYEENHTVDGAMPRFEEQLVLAGLGNR